MKSGHPASEDGPEAHGLHDPVHPGKADPVIGVEKVQTEKKTRTLMAVEEFDGGENGGWTIKY
jgi:hypothetical protein